MTSLEILAVALMATLFAIAFAAWWLPEFQFYRKLRGGYWVRYASYGAAEVMPAQWVRYRNILDYEIRKASLRIDREEDWVSDKYLK